MKDAKRLKRCNVFAQLLPPSKIYNSQMNSLLSKNRSMLKLVVDPLVRIKPFAKQSMALKRSPIPKWRSKLSDFGTVGRNLVDPTCQM